jgi:hypothetical protein
MGRLVPDIGHLQEGMDWSFLTAFCVRVLSLAKVKISSGISKTTPFAKCPARPARAAALIISWAPRASLPPSSGSARISLARMAMWAGRFSPCASVGVATMTFAPSGRLVDDDLHAGLMEKCFLTSSTVRKLRFGAARQRSTSSTWLSEIETCVEPCSSISIRTRAASSRRSPGHVSTNRHV